MLAHCVKGHDQPRGRTTLMALLMVCRDRDGLKHQLIDMRLRKRKLLEELQMAQVGSIATIFLFPLRASPSFGVAGSSSRSFCCDARRAYLFAVLPSSTS